jgi:hypothetical protein
MGILSQDDRVLFTDVMDMPCAYAIYDVNRTQAVATIRDFFAGNDIHCLGRYAEWAYQNMEANILSGRQAAALVADA